MSLKAAVFYEYLSENKSFLDSLTSQVTTQILMFLHFSIVNINESLLLAKELIFLITFL